MVGCLTQMSFEFSERPYIEEDTYYSLVSLCACVAHAYTQHVPYTHSLNYCICPWSNLHLLYVLSTSNCLPQPLSWLPWTSFLAKWPSLELSFPGIWPCIFILPCLSAYCTFTFDSISHCFLYSQSVNKYILIPILPSLGPCSQVYCHGF